jgi:hypothetical protein
MSYMRFPPILPEPHCGRPEGKLAAIPPIPSRVIDKVGRSGLPGMTN